MKIIILIFVAFLALITDAQGADEIHWTITGLTSVTFDWRGTNAENIIRYGKFPGIYTNQMTAITPNPLPSSSSGPFWEAKITGLEGNTAYYYSIANGPEHSFHTPPFPGDSGFIVYSVGDMGSTKSYPIVADVMKIIGNVYGNGFPDFSLLVGDLSYGDTTTVADIDQHFNDAMRWSQDAAYMPAWGNHEWDSSASVIDHLNNYEGRFDFPNSQTSPGADRDIGNGPGKDWYWFDYGNARFIAFPEQYTTTTRSDWNTKVQPIMAAAQANPNIDFIVTFGHSPSYSSSSSGNAELKGYLDGLGLLYSKYLLDLSGHHHEYERTDPSQTSGVTHIVTGGGHASPSTINTTQPSWSVFRTRQSGVLKLHFTDTHIDGEFICAPTSSRCSVAGTVLDSFVIFPTTSGSQNTPPSVSISAPANQSQFAQGAPVSFSATATDSQDGNKTASISWTSSINGPIGSGGSFTTSALSAGTHTITASVTDSGGLTGSSSITVTVNPPGGTSSIDIRVSSSSDDAEEFVAGSSSGSVSLTSSDLEMTLDGSKQTVGMRFNALAIPSGATIQNAYVQFAVDEVNTEPTSLTIYGQDIDNAPTFTTASGNISSRLKTVASVAWNNVPSWTTVGAAGIEQRTPNIAAVIQQIVNRSGWTSGNSLALIVIGNDNTSKRVARAFNGVPSAAPLLHVDYSAAGSGNTSPTTTISNPATGSAFAAGATITFTGTADDNEDGTLTSSLTWTSSINGPIGGGGSFTTSSLSAGTHTITASVTDSAGLTGSSSITVTVNPPGGTTSIDIRVSSSSDDAEEFVAGSSTGSMSLTSSDLEMTLDGSKQTVGLRFNVLAIPRGAAIQNAYVQFAVDEVNTEPTSLTIYGQDIDNAPTFTTASGNISSRLKTGASVAWNNVPSWTTVGAAGIEQRTPNIAAVIQQIVNRSGWTSGNSLALIVTGNDNTSKRVARAYNGVPAAAPLLHVEYSN